MSEFDDDRQQLIRKLATDDYRRLLLISQDSVEISQEALFTQWPLLQDQIGHREAAQQVRDLHRLMSVAAAWDEPYEDEERSYLANSVDVGQCSILKNDRGDWLSQIETGFVEASESEISRTERLRKITLYGSWATAVLFFVLTALVGYLEGEGFKPTGLDRPRCVDCRAAAEVSSVEKPLCSPCGNFRNRSRQTSN